MTAYYKLYIFILSFSLFGFWGSFAQSQNVPNQENLKFVNLNINDGLSNNSIATIFKDSKGFMWFGTNVGLNRFDGLHFKSFTRNVSDTASIPFNQIRYIFEDFDRNLWIRNETDFTIYNPYLEAFATPPSKFKETNIPLNGLRRLYADNRNNTWFLNTNNVLYKYSNDNGTSDSIKITPLRDHSNNYLNQLTEDTNGKFWAVTYTGELIQIDPDSKQILQQFQIGDASNELLIDYQLFNDSDDNIWVFTRGQSIGMFVYSQKSGKITHLKYSETEQSISSNMVADVLEDEEGNIWVGMDHGGINILDKNLNVISVIHSRDEDKYSLSENSVNSLYLDDQNIIWVGTFKKGLSYYHKDLIRFDHYKHMPKISNSLPFNDINCFAEDDKSNIWIGTNGGGLIYFNRKNNTFKSYKHDPDNPNSLSTDVIVSLYIDRDKTLWIGTYQGGLNRFDGESFTHYFHDPKNPTSVSDNRIWEIYEDSQHNFWIGTFNGGLNLMDRNTGQFTQIKAGDNSITSNFVMSIVEDSEKKLWLGTTHGLSMLDLKSKEITQYPPNPGVPGGLSGQHADDIHEDVRGLIWVASSQGLNVLNKTEGKFKSFTEQDGLTTSSIRTIEEDMLGNLWISTFNGISKIRVKEYSVQQPISELEIEIENFGTQDGLQGNEFNQKAAYRTRVGELIYGGANGFNLFYPEEISVYEPEEKILLTDFKVFNQKVKVNVPFRDRMILNRSITYEDKIVLKHDENVFSFEFAVLSYFHPEKNKFQYQLAGFNEEWLNVNEGTSEITFTNLDAGTYQLSIRASSDNTNWITLDPPLAIEILPPFWKSKYAYVLYFLTFILVLFAAWRALAERQRLKFVAEQEHLEAERMQQVDALKTKFFTNISHEFRTPLSLIISPLEKLIEKSRSQDQRNHLILIHRNARRLLGMVNQLLDFRKMELQKIEVKKSWGEMIGFIKDIGLSYEDLVQNKNIEYNFSSSCENLFTYFDKDKTDKIVNNLLSNAFKFTPENGKVCLELTCNTASEDSFLTIVVSDTGIGIPPEQQEHIFERFYQSQLPVSHLEQGTGIGLSMVKEYLSILGGTVDVESQIGKGSTFTLQIPVNKYTKEEENLKNSSEKQEEQILYYEAASNITEAPAFDNSKRTVAIVEDNADFRFYLRENLRRKYNIIEADNGLKGWKLIEEHIPDIVVSDVMMPEIDGIELCKRVKSNRNTKHIPIILLTAKTDTEPVLAGYESGVDSYLSKPFDFRILESRIQNLLNTREQLRTSYQSMIGINPEKVEVNSEDDRFLNKALEIVEKNIPESSFSVEDFGMEMGMSRVSLYKKILALTDKSPIEFIRIIRLKRAADLLTSSQLSVSEVAYQVGFNNPRYFSKYFSKEYEMLPSEYISKYRKLNSEISDETKEKFS